jgi:hypothetical protein
VDEEESASGAKQADINFCFGDGNQTGEVQLSVDFSRKHQEMQGLKRWHHPTTEQGESNIKLPLSRWRKSRFPAG